MAISECEEGLPFAIVVCGDRTGDDASSHGVNNCFDGYGCEWGKKEHGVLRKGLVQVGKRIVKGLRDWILLQGREYSKANPAQPLAAFTAVAGNCQAGAG